MKIDLKILDAESDKLFKKIELFESTLQMLNRGNKVKIADIDMETIEECVNIASSFLESEDECQNLKNKLSSLEAEVVPVSDFI